MSFLFWVKEKPVEIVAYTSASDSAAAEFFPISPAVEMIPAWWKEVERSSFDWETMTSNNTVKNCPGIINTFKKSFILPAWSDLALKIEGDNWRYQFADGKSLLSLHSNSQSGDKFYIDYFKFKVATPWVLKSPVSIHFSYPFYNSLEPPFYSTPSGINVPIRDHISVSIFMFIKWQKELKEYFIKAGSPLFQITPLTEKPVKIKCEVLSNEEFIKKRNLVSAGTFFYARGLKLLSSEPSTPSRTVRTTRIEEPKYKD